MGTEIARKHQPIPGPMPQTPEWLAAHGAGEIFTASEAADLCGMGRLQPLQVFRRHAGLDLPAEATERMQAGTLAEPYIAEHYARRVGMAVERPLPMFFHPVLTFLAATPDAERLDGRLAELKATTYRRAAEMGDEGSDWIPDQWLFQCQQQMLVMGDSVMDLAVMLDLFTLRVFTVQANPIIAEGIIQAAQEMRARLRANDPPGPDYSRPETLALVKELYHVRGDLRVNLDKDAASAWAKRQRAKHNQKRWQEIADRCEARVLAAIGDAACGVLPGGHREVARIPVSECTFTTTRRAYVRVQERSVK